MNLPLGSESTHNVRFLEDSVIKTYRSWRRAEPLREATALQHLVRYAPGLAPQLSGSDLHADPPWIRMSRVAGEQLDRPWSVDELRLLHQSLERLWAVPSDALPPLPGSPAHSINFWRSKTTAQGPPSNVAVRNVYDRALKWLNSGEAEGYERLTAQPVLGHGDPRAANILVEDHQVHLVDFEDAGLSHRAYELANTVEHLGNRHLGFEELIELDNQVDPELLICRRIQALFWFLPLYPGGSAERRNPPGTFRYQARRLAELLDQD